MLALQSFVSELGQRLKGAVWLFATGQQKLEDADQSANLGKLKDRFPPALRVHLHPSNIRDVVHKRLLAKRREHEALLRRIEREKRLHQKSPERVLQDLQDFVAPHIEGPNGIAGDVVRLIDDFVAAHPDRQDQTLVLVGRSGALYPFFRNSALLKHIDGKTHNVPVALLYPGERRDTTALSFMGELPADRDYRPRIFP